MKICASPGCAKVARKKGALCNACHMRRWRDNHPFEAVYSHLVQNARQRKKKVHFTLLEFKEWLNKFYPDYISRRGRGPEDLTLDRIKSNVDYYLWNLQVKTNFENSKKGNRDTKIKPWFSLEFNEPFTTEHPFRI